MEIELKLAVPAGELEKARRALLRLAPHAPAERSVLTSTYFDTSDRALRKAGLTLRVRRQGERLVQTVKTDDTGARAIAMRGEWEDDITGESPDPNAPESGSRLPRGIAGALAPLFVTKVTREALLIDRVPQTRIEAAIDSGEIRAATGEAAEPVGEIELELKSGEPAALYDAALELVQRTPLRIEIRSKAERGWHLIEHFAAPPAVVHSRPVALDPEASVEEALRRIGRACMADLLRNEAAVLAGEPEGVHQMRVALRRMRSALSTFKTLLPEGQYRAATEELRWLADLLGAVRNLDVFLADLLLPAVEPLSATADLASLRAVIEEWRGAAHRHLVEAALSPRYTLSVLRQLRWFEGYGWRDTGGDEPPAGLSAPIGEIAAPLLDRRWQALEKRGKSFARQTPQERHRLRIAVKKLRYSAELLASPFAASAVKDFVKPLKRLQDGLGHGNDVRVGYDLVSRLTARESGLARAAALVLGWHERSLGRGERKLKKTLRRLLGGTPPWHAE